MDQVSLRNYLEQDIKLNAREKEVYDALKKLRIATSWDILNYLGKQNPNYARPRLTDLFHKGLIIKIGKTKVNGIYQWQWMIK